MNVSDTSEKTNALELLNSFDEETLVRLLRLAKADEDKARANAEKNPLFVQLNKNSLNAFAFLSQENGLASGILMFLFDKMTLHNAVACSYVTLQEYFNSSRSSVYRAVKLLQDKKFIKIAKIGNVNVYHLDENLVWQRNHSSRKYAEFSATIILSESEQNRAEEAKKE